MTDTPLATEQPKDRRFRDGSRFLIDTLRSRPIDPSFASVPGATAPIT